MRFISVYSINLSPSCSKSTWRQTISRRKKSKSCGISGTSEIVPHPSFSLSLHYSLIPPKSPTVPPISQKKKYFHRRRRPCSIFDKASFFQGSISYNKSGIFFFWNNPSCFPLPTWVHQSWKEREQKRKGNPSVVSLFRKWSFWPCFPHPLLFLFLFLLLSSVQRKMGKALRAIFSILFFIHASIREIHLLPQKCKHQKSWK